MVHDEFEVLSQIQWFVACQHYATSWQQASQPRGRQRKKSTTPRGEISWNQVEIMRNQSRFPWNQARKSAQPSSPTHFYNIWRHFWGKSRGNQTEIRKSRTPKLLVADPSITTEWTSLWKVESLTANPGTRTIKQFGPRHKKSAVVIPKSRPHGPVHSPVHSPESRFDKYTTKEACMHEESLASQD